MFKMLRKCSDENTPDYNTHGFLMTEKPETPVAVVLTQTHNQLVLSRGIKEKNPILIIWRCQSN